MLVPSWSPMKFQSVFPVGVETVEGPRVGARLSVWPLAAAFLVVTPANYVQPMYSSCHTAFNVCHSSLPLNSPRLPFPGPELSVLPAPVLSCQPWPPLFVKTSLNLIPPACLFWKPLHGSVLRDAQSVLPGKAENTPLAATEPQMESSASLFQWGPDMEWLLLGPINFISPTSVGLIGRCSILLGGSPKDHLPVQPQWLKTRSWILLTFHSACCPLDEICSFKSIALWECGGQGRG